MDERITLNSSDFPSTIRYWLALKLVPRLAIKKKLILVDEYGLGNLFENTPDRKILKISEKQFAAIKSPDWQYIDEVIVKTKAANADIVCYDHDNYPKKLKEIHHPPLVLFVKGQSRLLSSQQVAIVGSRNATVYGRESAYNFAANLVRHNISVTSGLALGADAHAHLGALKNGGETIAVTATGIDVTYPARHKKLVRDIIDSGGAIVTEFLPGTLPKPGHFPKRNRIISGMSFGVLVVEATIKSGSLVTAQCAIEQNREVFAIPGSIKNAQSSGCHCLIKQGAKLVENFADIKEELPFIDKTGLNLKKNNNKENTSKKNCTEGLSNDPLLASVGHEITPVDTVVSRCKLPTDVVLTRLTMLELRGLVTAVPGGYLKNK